MRDMIIMIRANIGNKAKNAGIHCVNNLINALTNLNGLIRAHSTSMIHIINSKTGKKNLYNIRKGMNWSSNFMIASNTSLPKFKFNCGSNGPDGINNFNRSNKLNKSSGKPGGNGLRFGKVRENGMPNPGIAGPLGPEGMAKETSLGEQGIIFLFY